MLNGPTPTESGAQLLTMKACLDSFCGLHVKIFYVFRDTDRLALYVGSQEYKDQVRSVGILQSAAQEIYKTTIRSRKRKCLILGSVLSYIVIAITFCSPDETIKKRRL